MLNIGTLKSFDSTNYRAEVQLAGSMAAYLDNIPVARNIASDQMTVGRHVILAIPGGNPKDACVIAVWDGAAGGGGAEGVTDHGELDGLADDDHAQYLKEKASGGLAAEIPDHAANHDWLGDDAVNLTQVLLYSRRLCHCDWQVADQWTQSVTGSGSISIGIHNTPLQTGATNGSTAKLVTSANGFGAGAAATKFHGRFNSLPADSLVWLCACKATTPGNLENHIGFKIINGRIWASNSDGVAQTLTDTGVDMARYSEKHLLMIANNTIPDCKFYVSDVLKATHTTNMPSPWNFYIVHYITNTTAASKAWRCIQFSYVQ